MAEERKSPGGRRGDRRGRESRHGGTMALYGLNPVREALKAGGLSVIYIYAPRRKQLEDMVEEAGAKGVEVRVIHDREYFDRKFPKGHQGVAAEMSDGSSASYTIEELIENEHAHRPPIFIVLDLIEDPRNLGAIIRTAEAAGCAGVVVQDKRSAGLGPVAIKTSAGAAHHIPFCTVGNIKHALRLMKEAGVLIAGAEASDDSAAPWEVDLSGPLALVLGSEGSGMRKTVRELCDVILALPIRGSVGSLNVSVAAGALIYEALRQRMTGGSGTGIIKV